MINFKLINANIVIDIQTQLSEIYKYKYIMK